MVVPDGCIRAYPSAAPINGAVHGEVTITARTPVRNEPLSELDPTPPNLVKDDPISISVNRIIPIANIIMVNIATITGDCS